MIIEESATVEPTDKSIPPDAITNVIPIAITRLIELCSKIEKKFSRSKKYSEDAVNIIINKINPSRIPNLLIKVEIIFFCFILLPPA
jgi:hypothetical protein